MHNDLSGSRSEKLELSWPRPLSSIGTRLLAFQYFLERSERLPAREFFRFQSRQIYRIARVAVKECPFYRERIHLRNLRDRQAAAESWAEIPILTRQELQTQVDAITSQELPRLRGPFDRQFTSGSSGMPVMVLGTPATRLAWSALTIREHLWHQRRAAGSLAVIRAMAPGKAEPPGLKLAQWGSPVAKILRTGPSYALNVKSSMEECVAFLMQHDPDYLLTYPSVILELARAVQRGYLELSRLKQARTFGELLAPHVRAEIEKTLDCKVADVYSAEEVGYMAIQCPISGLYHIQGESVLVEVLDDKGRPCPVGQVGRVVVTSLWNRATPIIRYEIGDYAEVGPRCPCGRTLPTLRRVIGRKRNMLVLPDGRRFWPMPLADADAEESLSKLPPIQQFQVIQRSLHLVEVRLVVPRPLSESEQSKTRDYIQAMLGYSFEVRLVFVDEIPRGTGGKFEDFINECDGEP